mmetsp:Transcript_33643/g.59588  ORF Transcript_33643/g.59588 Transcript_33643/m.59588 type:complete len:146 (-) Transcript_33643:27-464(-)
MTLFAPYDLFKNIQECAQGKQHSISAFGYVLGNLLQQLCTTCLFGDTLLEAWDWEDDISFLLTGVLAILVGTAVYFMVSKLISLLLGKEHEKTLLKLPEGAPITRTLLREQYCSLGNEYLSSGNTRMFCLVSLAHNNLLGRLAFP